MKTKPTNKTFSKKTPRKAKAKTWEFFLNTPIPNQVWLKRSSKVIKIKLVFQKR